MKFEGQPYFMLHQMAKQVGDSIENQPMQKDFSEVWSGIGFLSCGCLMSAAMGDVTEIITLPKYTIVPGSKSWVMGIANVRGALIPIIDLEQFFGFELIGNRRNYRVLIVSYMGGSVGLVVSKVIGMQHLDREIFRQCEDGLNCSFSEFVDASYTHGGEEWYRFSPSRLFESEEFINASLLKASDETKTRIAAA